MTSTMESPPQPLKDKLTDVKSLLKTANNRLQDEVTKYEIFTTKASASSSSNAARLNGGGGGGGDPKDKKAEIIRTITDISTLESVLSCPIFDRIVNVTDSLDQLSYQLNLHPSITEFDIDANSGELILTPPMEFVPISDFISTDPNQYTDNHLERSLNFAQNTTALVNDLSMNQISSDSYDASNADLHRMQNNGYARAYPQRNGGHKVVSEQNYQTSSSKVQDYRVPPSDVISPVRTNNTEKLITNGHSRISDRLSDEPSYLQPNSTDTQDSGRRQYRSNGHFAPNDDSVTHRFQSTHSMDQNDNQNNEQRRASYSNELYRTSHGLNESSNMAINQHYNSQMQKQQHQQQRATRSNERNHNSQRGVYPQNTTANGRMQINQVSNVHYNRGSCSPSSAGSTVRLADECDSGASSFHSQQARGGPTSYQSKGSEGLSGTNYCSVEAVKQLQPDAGLESTEVTFERDENGLGILIAGYTLQGKGANNDDCEDNDQDIDKEISGIFIKNITPGSPADRCGKIKAYDQIVSVNGIKLAGYTNDEAVELMKQPGRAITLELTRHTDKVKFDKLVTNLSRAECARESIKSKTAEKDPESRGDARISTPTKSSIPISRSRDSANNSPIKPSIGPKPKTALVQVSTYQESSMRKAKAQEAIYKNDSLSKTDAAPRRDSRDVSSPLSPSSIPIAAQRGGTNKVIETKQGSRNTIDIKSPACQTVTATYVNKLDDTERPDSTTTKQNSLTERLRREASDEFVRLDPGGEPEWDKDAKIIVLHKDKPSQGLGFAVKEYTNPKNPSQPIIMITSITPGGIADKDGRLSVGDLLIFVDDKDLRHQVLSEAVKALKKTDGEASLGVLKLKRS